MNRTRIALRNAGPLIALLAALLAAPAQAESPGLFARLLGREAAPPDGREAPVKQPHFSRKGPRLLRIMVLISSW